MKNRALNQPLAIFLAVFLMLAQIGFTVFASEDGGATTPGTITTAATPGATSQDVIATFDEQPNVTFTAKNGVNLSNPTNVVFEADNAALLEGYSFYGVRFVNVTAGGIGGNTLTDEQGVTYVNGVLTVPAEVFGLHSGRYPLSPGTYIAEITFWDGSSTYIEYSAECIMTLVVNTSTDAQFLFAGNYEDLADVLLNDKPLDQDGIDGRNAANLSGYGNYGPGPLGTVEEGSVKVTLFKDFLKTLTGGTYKLKVTFKDGSFGELEFEIPSSPPSPIDPLKDAKFRFFRNYTDLADIFLNGTLLDHYGIDGRYAANLGGYGGFNENNPLGIVEEGSVIVTLYTNFLRTLAGGTYTLSVTFNDGKPPIEQDFEVPDRPAPSYTPSAGSSSGRSSGSNTSRHTVAEDSRWLERTEAERLAGIAKAQRKNDVRTFKSGKYGVRGDAWEKLAKLRYYHDTMDDTAIQVRIYFDNPDLFKKEILVSAYVKGPEVNSILKKFEKWYSNKARVIHFDQQTDWKQPVEVAAKIDLDGMDTKNLYFYYYDKADNTYKRIENPGYRIDKNGYLHFSTPYAGDIIISDGLLKKK